MKSLNSIIGSILLLMSVYSIEGTSQYHKEGHRNYKKNGHSDSDLLTKINFSQKGYIQFLRYVVDVPVITEYTFCLWMRSYNLTYSHPLLSYSKHEKERRIRVWISPRGKAINLEINGVEVFSISMRFREHQWYHICQSWSSDHAVWELFVNGRKKLRGYVPKLFGVPIKPGGDIVVGQEYTDFDKGLEDGIEGDIFGFNFVLSATSSGHAESSHFSETPKALTRRSTFSTYSMNSQFKNSNSRKTTPILSNPNLDPELLSLVNELHISTRDSVPSRKITAIDLMNFHPRKDYQHSSVTIDRLLSKKNRSRRLIKYSKSIGKKLVELSANCKVGKGAPLNGKEVLISWTKTTVRVFGGAIVKHVKPFC